MSSTKLKSTHPLYKVLIGGAFIQYNQHIVEIKSKCDCSILIQLINKARAVNMTHPTAVSFPPEL